MNTRYRLPLWRNCLHLCILVALFCVTWTASATATLSDPLAVELKSRGDAAMVEGDYEAALLAYEKATAVEPDPSLLYNRARALQALERYADSLAHFEEFKRKAPPELLERVPQLEEMILRVRARVTEVVFELPSEDFRIFIRDEERFVSPGQVLRIDSGPAELRVEAVGFEKYERLHEFKGGTSITIAPELVPLSNKGQISINSRVPLAEVLVDGKSVGLSPVVVTLDAGVHKIELRHPKYHTATSQRTLSAGEHITVDMGLRKKAGLHQKWWFWAGLGAVAVTGVTLGVVLTTEREPDAGDIPPGTIGVPF